MRRRKSQLKKTVDLLAVSVYTQTHTFITEVTPMKIIGLQATGFRKLVAVELAVGEDESFIQISGP